MPTYCFTHVKSGETIERYLPASRFRRSIRHNGRRYVINVGAQQVATSRPSIWPKVSDFAGCHPSQIEEFRAEDRKHNLKGVDYTPQGDCVFMNPKAEREWHRQRGLRNACSYFS